MEPNGWHGEDGRNGHEHAVRFYDDDAGLLDAVAGHVGAALRAGDAAIVAITPAHLDGLALRLRDAGLDLDAATADGRLVVLDAADTLEAITRDGRPDAAVLATRVGEMLDRAAASAPTGRIAVFGEMVALSCADGRHDDALLLERLWDDLARERALSLLCAYPMTAFARSGDGPAFAEILALHDRVEVSGGQPTGGAGEQTRALAVLQQKARSLDREVAARERAQADLQRREAEMAELVENAPVAIHQLGADGTILWANRAELDLLGYPANEYVGRNVAEFHADPGVIADILARLGRGESLHEQPARLRASDGSIRHVRISSNTRRDGDGMVHTRCFTRDVTDRHKTWEASTRLAAIVDSSDDAIIGKALDGTVTSWNRAAEELYGYTAEEMVGSPITTIVPPELRGELAGIVERLKRGERIAHHDTERVRKDGTRVPVSLSISPIYDADGTIVGASKIARDISERRVAEQQQQEFLAMVAHDLRSPLTAVRGFAQLLRRRGTYDARAVNAIIAQADQMTRLVADVLEVSRLEAGRLVLHRRPVDLAALAAECIDSIGISAANQPFRLEAPDHPIVGEWDPDRLSQVLVNLLDNALKFGQAREIVVRVEQSESEACVSVTDHGAGIAADDLPRIFDRFYRADGSASTATGVGLGLFISRGMIEAHGGRIWAESAPGFGSRFTVALPLAAVPEVVPQSVAAAAIA